MSKEIFATTLTCFLKTRSNVNQIENLHSWIRTFFYQSELSIENKFLSKEVQISCLKHKSLTQNEGILYFQKCNRYVLISSQILTIEFWKKIEFFFYKNVNFRTNNKEIPFDFFSVSLHFPFNKCVTTWNVYKTEHKSKRGLDLRVQ